MPLWKPEPIWSGQECFIIGGGKSLEGWDFSLLKNENTIGCNNAFRLGPEICKICLFVDRKFLYDGKEPRKGFYDELAKFPNPVVTNDNQFKFDKEPWIKYIPRLVKGFSSTPDALAFNACCGASAVNLAVLLGAKIIYLLGFDMFLDKDKKPNWHNNIIDKPSDEVYVRFLASFGHVSRGLKEKFPDVKVFNVTNHSNLNLFPKVSFDLFWLERNVK